MTYRELFREIMYYGVFDRMPVLHWGTWTETQERWKREGLPGVDLADPYAGAFSLLPRWCKAHPGAVTQHEFLDAHPLWADIRINLGLYPAFPSEVLEETDEYRIARGPDGVVSKSWKHKGSIPHYMDFMFKDARAWPEFKKRLQPDSARIPADLDRQIARAEASGLPIEFETASLMGVIRNWMGVENMSYLMYDDRDVYADMVMTLADLTCWAMDYVLPRTKVDLIFGWEDICGRSGPLVSPHIFDACVAPGYRKIREKAERYGVTLYGVDCDGDITDLIGHWMDAGVNLQFPIEVGVWKGDALAFRKRYGKELRIIGNLDKFALEKGHAAIDLELDRLMPLMREGGFIALPDHGITPGVSLADYRWYLDRLRTIRI